MTEPAGCSYHQDGDAFVFEYKDATVRVEELHPTRSGGLMVYMAITGHEQGEFMNAGQFNLYDARQRDGFAAEGSKRDGANVPEWQTRLLEISQVIRQEVGVGQGAGPPDLRSLDDFLAGVDPHAEWLVEGLLERGNLYLLGARYKTGKSILSMNLILSASRGGRWLDREVYQGQVAWFQLEDSDRTIVRRWDKMCQGPNSSVQIVRGPWHLTEENLEATVQALQGQALVVVDPIISAVGVDKWSDMGQVRGSFDLWRQVARRTNAVVLLTAHHRKAAGEEAEQIAGSHQAAATVDGIIELRKGGGRLQGHERRLEFLFRDLPDMDDLIIGLNADILVFEVVGTYDQRKEEKASLDAQRLADAVQVGDEVQSRLREEVLCWDTKRFQAALEAALAQGLVRREKRPNPETKRQVWWVMAGADPPAGDNHGVEQS